MRVGGKGEEEKKRRRRSQSSVARVHSELQRCMQSIPQLVIRSGQRDQRTGKREKRKSQEGGLSRGTEAAALDSRSFPFEHAPFLTFPCETVHTCGRNSLQCLCAFIERVVRNTQRSWRNTICMRTFFFLLFSLFTLPTM